MTAAASKVAPEIDPVVTEIIRNGLIAITEEMKKNLMRTAYNVIIYEALDFTVGLFDAEGNTVSIGIGLPMFIRGMSDTIKAKLAHFGHDGLHPGDVLLTNDAYLTGSHLNHLTFSVPIFHEGDLVAFSSCMAHWQDIGGVLHGMTTDIYSEGLQIPILKIWRAGQPNQEILDLIKMNVRVPERAMGDLRAQVATVKTGERRFLELIDRYGIDAVLGAIRLIMDQSEAAARDSVRSIPDGIYEAESFMDDDGVDLGRRIPIKVIVTVADDQMTIDLSNVADQVKGFYNSGETAGRSCAQVAFKCLTSATDLPINDGSFRPLSVILPRGTVVSAERPAAMRWWMTYPMTVVDTIFKALASAVPEKVAAGHHADLCSCHISGYHPRDGKLFLATTGLIGGGWGAKRGEDGVSATICINDGDTHNAPCEQAESKMPVMIESYSLRPDSCGAGQYRGGLGTQKTIKALSDIVINVQIDRVECLPWGLFGGLPAAGNSVSFCRAGELEVFAGSGKLLAHRVRAGDRYTLRSGGGGGFGDPLDRRIEDVEHDVRQKYVSLANARILYGIIIDPNTGRTDREATAALRDQMRSTSSQPDRGFHEQTHDCASSALLQPRTNSNEQDRELVAAVQSLKCCG
jgi:N-methylhydantoinase B